MHTIGMRLKAERERLKLSQTDFGDAGGVQKLSQINYEQGKRSPDAEYLSSVAKIGADIYYVITGERQENVASTPIEIAFLRNCRAFKTNEARLMALNALVGMSGYKPEAAEYDAANDKQAMVAAQTTKEPYKGGKND